MPEGLWGEGVRGVMPAKQVVDGVLLETSLDQGELTGERVKGEGENIYLQMQLREKFLKNELEKSINEQDVGEAVNLMTPSERIALTRMTKDDLRALAKTLVSRLGPTVYRGGIETVKEGEDIDRLAAK